MILKDAGLFVALWFCWYIAFQMAATPTVTQDETKDVESDMVFARYRLNYETVDGQHCESFENTCIHVVYAATGGYVIPLLASMNSILVNTEHKVVFHLLMAPGDSVVFVNYLKETDIKPIVEIVEFNDARVKPLIRVWEGLHPEIYYNTFNYARFYLPDLFPTVDKMIYLDPDTVVPSDISSLWNKFLSRQRRDVYFMAVKAKETDFGGVCHLLNCEDEEIKEIVTEPDQKYFNAGVFVTDLAMWRKEKITDEIEYRMKQNLERKMWKWGSQGPLVLVFYGKWEHLGYQYNERGRGTFAEEEYGIPVPIQVYHFTSHVKPWRANGKKLWHLWCPFTLHQHLYWFCKPDLYLNLVPLSVQDFQFVPQLYDKD